MTDIEMRNYYVRKSIRYTYILGALDERIDKDLKRLVNNKNDDNGNLFATLNQRMTELNETRALITEEIDYCTARVKEYDAEENAKKEAE